MSMRSAFGLRRGRLDGVTVGRLVVPIVLVLIWQGLAMITGRYALASPVETAAALRHGIQDGWILAGFRRTMTELVIAFAIAAVTGIWVGVVLGLDEFWYDVFEPLMLGLYSIPKVTLFPIFLFIFQFGMDSKIAFGWFHGIFPIAILMMSATATVEKTHLQVGRSLQLSRWQMFREIVVPSVLPSLVIGLRLGFNLTFLGIILGEMFASRSGLGYTLMELITGVQVARMLAVIVVLVLVAAVVNVGFFKLENYLGSRGEETANVTM